MNTTVLKNQIATDVDFDANQITMGTASAPTLNASGIRSFNQGEKRILRAFESRVRNLQNAINKAMELLSVWKNKQKIMVDVLTNENEHFNNDQQEDQKALSEVNNKLERCEGVAVESPSDTEVSKDKKDKTRINGLSFLLSCALIEMVIFLTTFSFQQETMSISEIWMRGIYCAGQYIFTTMIFYKYNKTQLKVVKIFLSISIIMCFITLIHVICVSFFYTDASTAISTAGFDLNQLEMKEATVNIGIVTRLLQAPGLLEFIFTAFIIFINEIVCIDYKKTKDLASESNVEDNAMICDNAEWLRLRRINILKDKQSKLTKRICDRANGYKQRIDEIDSKINNIKEEIESAQSNLGKYQQELDALLDEAVSELASYRDLLIEELAFRLDVDSSSITYETATLADVKRYYNL